MLLDAWQESKKAAPKKKEAKAAKPSVEKLELGSTLPQLTLKCVPVRSYPLKEEI